MNTRQYNKHTKGKKNVKGKGKKKRKKEEKKRREHITRTFLRDKNPDIANQKKKKHKKGKENEPQEKENQEQEKQKVYTGAETKQRHNRPSYRSKYKSNV